MDLRFLISLYCYNISTRSVTLQVSNPMKIRFAESHVGGSEPIIIKGILHLPSDAR